MGARRFPIEDVPEDAFERTLPREISPATGQVELIAALLALYAPKAPPLRFKRARPVGEGVFGGRWLHKARGIVIWAHDEVQIERGVTVHEVCHYLRDYFGHDALGYHDAAFLALVEDAYRQAGVPVTIAKLIEGQYPPTWSW